MGYFLVFFLRNSEKEKFYTQLRVLANVRKLQPIIDKTMDNIYIMIDISEDPLYSKGIVEGEERGVEKGVRKTIRSLIEHSDFSNLQIAELSSVSIELVEEIRFQINNGTCKD